MLQYYKKFKKRWRKKSRSNAAARRSSKIPWYASTSHRKKNNKLVQAGSKSATSAWSFKKDDSRFWVWMRLWGMFILLPFVILSVWFYLNVIKELPDIADIENADFNQTTVITDRNGVELYKLYEENRDYIDFDEISENFVNALVATEDQRFWENPGVDRKGIIRAGITDIRYGKTQWWSTITQQVIKNILLTPEKKITRKLKEIILAVKLVNFVKDDISSTYKDLSSSEVDKRVKEHILELYANYIFLWNNAYGIEIASQNYFGESAKNLSVLQWAIMAGIPQAPSRYDPYTNRALLMWGVAITNKDAKNDDTDPVDIPDNVRSQTIVEIKDKISTAQMWNKRDDSRLLSFVTWLLDFSLDVWGETYDVEYNLWRKDAVLARMFEMWYITEDELKTSLKDALDLEFNRKPREIKAPHFVFWVIEQLEREYDQEVLRTWWLTIKTSLDYDIQKLAESSITDNSWTYAKYGADNAWMLYVDSNNGDVLAYVWSKDYNNDAIDGQVDMVQAKRQPWSIIKPLLYSLWFMNMKLTVDSPIYDIPLKIWNNEPQNADGEFNGLTTIRQALASSRNIPAIKMFLSVWWETIFKDFLRKIWFENLIMNRDYYGYALGLWAAETPMMEMANAYTHLSAMWKPAVINPILEVRWADGAILYQKEIELQEQVIPGWVAYLLRRILSNKENFPESWRANFTIPGVQIATKSGTTNIVQWENKLPRDGWMASYTPSKVLMLRWWNTDGSAMAAEAYWGWLNSPSRKTFLTRMKSQQYIVNETAQEVDVKKVNISKLSWKLANVSTPLVFMQESLWFIHSLPTEYDNQVNSYQVDTLCFGKPSDLTPKSDLSTAWYIRPQTMMPWNFDQDDVLTRRKNGGTSRYSSSGIFSLSPGPNAECQERASIAQLWEITMELMQPVEWQQVTKSFSIRHQTTSPFVITDMKLYLWDVELSTISYNKEWPIVDIRDITLPAEIQPGEYILKAEIFDEKWYSDSRSVKLVVWDINSDKTPPYLIEDKIKVTPKSDGSYDIVLLFGDDASSVKDGRLTIWWELVHTFDGNIANFSTVSVGTLEYEVFDTSNNKVEWSIVIQWAPEPTPAPTPAPTPTPAPEPAQEVDNIDPQWSVPDELDAIELPENDTPRISQEEITNVVNGLFPSEPVQVAPQ